jgi:hypothetical protein
VLFWHWAALLDGHAAGAAPFSAGNAVSVETKIETEPGLVALAGTETLSRRSHEAGGVATR